MAKRAALRAGDADREHVAERLRQATVEGRLLAEELEDRLEAAFSARSYGELDALVADLPGPADGRRRRLATRPVPVLALAAGITVVLPLVLLVLAAVMFVVVDLMGMLAIWFVLAWWLLGRRRGPYAAGRMHGARRRAYITRF